MRQCVLMLAGTRRSPESTAIPPVTETAAFVRDRRTWTAYLLLGLFAYLETTIGPAMHFLRAELGLGYAVASLHFSAFAAGAVGVGLTGERCVRRVGRHGLLWGGLGGMIVGALLIAFSPNVIGTVLGALVMGMFGTLSLLANQAILSDLHGAQRTIALTESNVVATSAAIAAPLLIGGFAAMGLGWQTALVLTVPCGALLWGIFRGVRFPPSRQLEESHAGGQRLPAAFWLLWLVLFLLVAVEWCMAYWGADFLASVVGLDRAAAATAMTLFFVAMAGGRLFGSRLARRYPSVSLLLAAIGVAVGGFLVFWLAPAPALSLAGLFLTGLGVANFYPLTVALATGSAPHLVDQAAARLAVAGGLALLTAPFVVGALSDAAGMRWGFGIVAPLLVLAFAGLLMTRWLTLRAQLPRAISALPPASS
jgi:MFS family permease